MELSKYIIVFIVLEIYNFDSPTKITAKKHQTKNDSSNSGCAMNQFILRFDNFLLKVADGAFDKPVGTVFVRIYYHHLFP